MDKENAKTKHRLRNLASISDFEELLNAVMLSEDERNILRFIYVEQKSLSYIADELGMAEVTVKRKHSKALKKIGKCF